MADDKQSKPTAPPSTPAVSKSAPEAIKTDPAQAQRLQTEGEKRGPTVGSPQQPKPITIDSVLETRLDPEGRVKQQDAAGNILGDENDPEFRRQQAEKSADLRRREDAANSVPVVGSGTTLTTESLEHTAANERQRSSSSIQTSKTESPYKARMRDLEQQLKASSDDKSKRAVTARANMQTQLDELKRLESQRFSGGNINMPRGMLFAAPEAQEKNADYHLRWVNVNQAGRGEAVQALGYERVPESDGGMQRGDLALFRIPREAHARGEIVKRDRTRQQLESVNKDADKLADQVIEELERRGYNMSKKSFMSTSPDEG